MKIEHHHPCLGKIKHSTWEAAIQVLSRMRQQNPSDVWLMPYSCACCSMWHLGHLPGWKRAIVLRGRPELASTDSRRSRRVRHGKVHRTGLLRFS
jgi:hypothetical protein